MRSNKPALLLVASALTLLLSGCAGLGHGAPARDHAAAARSDDLEKLPEADRNRVLSQGYAQLYAAANGLRWLDDFLLVKFESNATRKVIDDLATYSAQLKVQLEELARNYPSLSLDDDGLPLLEKNKRKAQQIDRAKTLLPLVGAHGADFERTLLLTESGALNQLRFLAQALADAEKSTTRREFVLGVRQRFDELYVETVNLLDRQFFRSPADTPMGAAGSSE
ncbi:MAG: hypothetical protein WC809_21300 [Sinimarinibacterium sp.]|jgi:hypothetical protein